MAEEGLDIPDCNLVVRFNLFETLIQYVQSRGRARQADSTVSLLFLSFMTDILLRYYRLHSMSAWLSVEMMIIRSDSKMFTRPRYTRKNKPKEISWY